MTIAGIVLAITVAGYIVPAFAVSDGLHQFSGKQQLAAAQAIAGLEDHLASPSTYKLYTTKISVTSVEETGDVSCPYVAALVRHTYFGIKSNSYLVEPGCSVSSN